MHIVYSICCQVTFFFFFLSRRNCEVTLWLDLYLHPWKPHIHHRWGTLTAPFNCWTTWNFVIRTTSLLQKDPTHYQFLTQICYPNKSLQYQNGIENEIFTPSFHVLATTEHSVLTMLTSLSVCDLHIHPECDGMYQTIDWTISCKSRNWDQRSTRIYYKTP